jgi:hypothetical protein
VVQQQTSPRDNPIHPLTNDTNPELNRELKRQPERIATKENTLYGLPRRAPSNVTYFSQ